MLEPLAGIALGLAGSIHCAGMCGPIAISLPRSGAAPRREVVHRMTYQVGRVITYTSLGAIIGIGGSALALAGYSRSLSLTAGFLMIGALAVQLVWRKELISGAPVERIIAPVKATLRSLLSKHGAMTHLGIGLLNGLLPCGLVTAALIGSLGTGSMSGGALFMLGFGLGTLPVMSAIAIGGSRISCGIRERFRFAAPAIGLMVASLMLLRGMGLGIPMISPAPTLAAHASSTECLCGAKQ